METALAADPEILQIASAHTAICSMGVVFVNQASQHILP
jgi:hypothetical protein